MVKTKLIALFLLVGSLSLSAQTFTWETVPMDGSRVGASIPSSENVTEALGSVKLGIYTAPNGKEYAGNVAKVARLMLKAQPEMAFVKEKIGFAEHDMLKDYPESELSNMLVDCLMAKTAEITGKRVDVGLLNFGGIRCDLHAGDLILDNFLSMMPFKNNLVYIELKGEDLRALFEQFAATRVEVLGGVRLVIKDKQLVSAKIGGEPLDDSKVYSLATIDFLLNGGDHVFAARNAIDLVVTDVLVRDAVIPYVRSLTDAGKPVEYKVDGRVVIL